LKKISAVLAVLGLLLATVMVGYFGFDSIIQTVGAVGWSGFVSLLVWQAGLFLVLGAAWELIVPREATAPPWAFLWGRMVRDSAGNCLPFSQMGGFVLGARAVTLQGVSWPLATASTVVDVTAEFLAQIAFAVLGVAILLVRAPGSGLAGPLAGALLLAVAGGAGFIWVQRRGSPIFARLARRMAREWFPEVAERVDALQGAFGRIYRRPARIALGSALHLAGWTGTGVAGWLAYRLLGADIDLLSVLAVEGLLNATLGVAFLVPGAIGVQEAGYAVFGTLFGLAPELSIGVSLLRRAKDLALGIPILLVWQIAEARRLRMATSTST
jgi:glycosyltransferase 2 family protein